MRTARIERTTDNLYHNNGDGTFTDVSKKAGVDDPERRYGLTAIWTDFDNNVRVDCFVTNDGQANYLYKGDGNRNSRMSRSFPEWPRMKTDSNRPIWEWPSATICTAAWHVFVAVAFHIEYQRCTAMKAA